LSLNKILILNKIRIWTFIKNNLFKISSFNIYEKIQTIFRSLKKFRKQRKPENPLKKTKKKKLENKPRKQKTKQYRKKIRRFLMGRGPYHCAHGRSEQRRARGRSIWISSSVRGGDTVPTVDGPACGMIRINVIQRGFKTY
jgi:hypothetical protein